jgi:Family of unknown function (DUF6455)
LSRVSEIMERLGIDPSGGVVPALSLLYATALYQCKTCPSMRACADWTDSAPGSASFAPPFCPVRDILSELQFRQLKRTVSSRAGRLKLPRFHRQGDLSESDDRMRI